MKLETMSKNIVEIMKALSKNEGLARLLSNNISNPFSIAVGDKSKLIDMSSENAKIFPYPFDPDATLEDGSFVRVYYNDGEFNSNETIAESDLHIDVIVAKSLWLIDDGDRALIRPYEIIGRIIDTVGARAINSNIRLGFTSYQHLAVNGKFDAIRLYCEYMSIESKQSNPSRL